MKLSLILSVVEDFYAEAQKDVMIGYHFRFIEDFDEHIPRIAEFWNLQFNQVVSDRAVLPFNLLEVHRSLNVKRGEFGRWVKLFEDALDRNRDITDKQKSEWLKKIEHFKNILEEKLLRS